MIIKILTISGLAVFVGFVMLACAIKWRGDK